MFKFNFNHKKEIVDVKVNVLNKCMVVIILNKCHPKKESWFMGGREYEVLFHINIEIYMCHSV